MKQLFKSAIVLSVLCLGISSCTIHRSFNIKFQLIDNNQMTELLDKRHVDFDQKDLAYLKDLKSFVEFNNGKFIVPDYFMFNKEGHLINSSFNQD